MSTLNYNSNLRVSNFYENSFKQLSDIQQKQTGLIVGAVVADAAARALDGCTADEIAEFTNEQLRLSCNSGKKGGKGEEEEEPFVFAEYARAPLSLCRTSGATRHHSYTCLLLLQLLRVMASARGEFPVSYVKDDWVSVARAHPKCFAKEHASLLHVIGVVLPLPVIYPWADDATLRSYARPFIDFLTEPPVDQPKEVMGSTLRSAVKSHVFSALGIVLRCLQSNPDPYRNAAIMAAPGTAGIFPEDLLPLCPPPTDGELRFLSPGAGFTGFASGAKVDESPSGVNCDGSTFADRGSDPLLLFPARSFAQDVRVAREGITIARKARTFADGVRASIRLGGPVCQRSIIVGALLGARVGVRRIPLSWLSATHDHSPLATMAMEVAQWSWNPPRD